MTGNEIIKALECCKKCNTTGSIDECCPKCPLSDYDGCCDKLIVELEGFFNRQKAEIESKEIIIERLKECVDEAYKEAITEFADRLIVKAKRDIELYGSCTGYGTIENIENLVKEMVGD